MKSRHRPRCLQPDYRHRRLQGSNLRLYSGTESRPRGLHSHTSPPRALRSTHSANGTGRSCSRASSLLWPRQTSRSLAQRTYGLALLRQRQLPCPWSGSPRSRQNPSVHATGLGLRGTGQPLAIARPSVWPSPSHDRVGVPDFDFRAQYRACTSTCERLAWIVTDPHP